MQQKNPNYQPRYNAEWDMNGEILRRFSENMYYASRNNQELISYRAGITTANYQYGILWDLWDDIGSHTKLIDQTEIKNWFKTKFTRAEQLRQKNTLSKQLIWLLADILHKLREVQQMCGLGIKLELKRTQKQKIKEKLGIKTEQKNG